MKENRRKAMIAEVMDGFDFENVRKIMTFLDWEWAIENGERTVPSVYRLMKQAEQLLADVTKHEDNGHHEVSMGGLRAIFDEDGDLELRFEIEESTAYGVDFDEEGNFNYK